VSFVLTGPGHKRMIFTVTPGRSGTGYLAWLLKDQPGIHCEHEGQPNFVEVMNKVQTSSQIATDFWVNRKLPFIESTSGIYVETSHVFCKGFLEPLLNLGIVPDLVLLRRDCKAVAASLLRLNTIPGKTEKGRKFLLPPEDLNMTDEELCYAYCLEIERRMIVYGEKVIELGGRVVETSLDDVNEFFDSLNLPARAKRAGKKINAKKGRK